jgi:hypothetical protein
MDGSHGGMVHSKRRRKPTNILAEVQHHTPRISATSCRNVTATARLLLHPGFNLGSRPTFRTGFVLLAVFPCLASSSALKIESQLSFLNVNGIILEYTSLNPRWQYWSVKFPVVSEGSRKTDYWWGTREPEVFWAHAQSRGQEMQCGAVDQPLPVAMWVSGGGGGARSPGGQGKLARADDMPAHRPWRT